MKTFYLIKSCLPALFLPIAPGMVQVELARQGLLNYGSTAYFAVLMQILFTCGIVIWIAYTVNRKERKKAFLRMSCVSKKVHYNGKWMTVEHYLAEFHNVQVSHGMTPEESTAWLRESEDYVRSQAIDMLETGETISAPGEDMLVAK
jgi:hypothetical protein